MYKVTPTTNLVLDGDALSTIKAQENQIGNNLSPGNTYLKKDFHLWLLTQCINLVLD